VPAAPLLEETDVLGPDGTTIVDTPEEEEEDDALGDDGDATEEKAEGEEEDE
jgi:hypothetical protein